jgi:hypothetical protein
MYMLPLLGAVRVFAAIQGHWLSACLRVLLELKVPEALEDAGQVLSLEQVAFQEFRSIHDLPPGT